MGKKNRFCITGTRIYVVAECTGEQPFPEPIATFPKRKHAKIFCDTMNRRWSASQQFPPEPIEPIDPKLRNDA